MMTTLRMSIASGFLDCEFWNWFQPGVLIRLVARSGQELTRPIGRERRGGARQEIYHFFCVPGLPADFLPAFEAVFVPGADAVVTRDSSSGTMRRAFNSPR